MVKAERAMFQMEQEELSLSRVGVTGKCIIVYALYSEVRLLVVRDVPTCLDFAS